jgi:carbonic anhydrase
VGEGVVDDATPPRVARHRLVEYAVARQVAFLVGRLPDRVTVAGYVHDEDGAYGSFPGRHYLVALDGETEPGTIRSRLPGAADAHVASLLS